MKIICSIFLTVLLVAALSVPVLSEDTAAKPAQTPAKELKPQTVCPVMGKPIDSTVYTDIQGQRVYFCCPGCVGKVKADPDKYFKAAEGVLFQNIQKTCPVSGEDLLNHKTFVDFEGRRVYLCCEKCVKSFNDDPQKYLSQMSAPAKVEQPSKAEQPAKSGPSCGH